MNIKKYILIIILFGTSFTSFSQTTDSTKIIQHFSGSVSVTNNGISLVPSFSLGKPATVLLLSIGSKRFSVDPDIRFSMNGKPWTFLFWTRYKLLTEGKFKMTTGTHLGLNFRTATLPINGVATETQIVRRYLAAELAPNYFVVKNVSFGSYYLYSRGIDFGTVKNTHFITLNTNFARIPIGSQLYLRAVPQMFYLNQDAKDGYYANATVTVAKKNFPLSVSSIINKELRSNIPGSKDFIWNVSLVYSFNKNYVSAAPVL
jgi:hypothetical protein